MKGNKGEWSEPYVALHLLAYGKLLMADTNGDKKTNDWMKIVSLLRNEAKDRTVKYVYQGNQIVIKVNGNTVKTIDKDEFAENVEILKQDIVKGKGASFEVSDKVTEFFKRIELYAMKAKSINKSDIFVTVTDPRTSLTREDIGFSIKSKFGKDPTLFNTAPASGVVYKITGMNDVLMQKINSMLDKKGHTAVMDRCNALKNEGCTLEFIGFPIASKAKCEAFRENLELINPHLPNVIERILWNHFFEGESKTDIKDVIQRIINENPLNISRPEIKYPYMMKSFLYASYCGLTASTLWDGKSDVNGGYITVDEQGDVLANYALESDSFKEYLYNMCYLEFPSTGPGHGDYAKVYKKGEIYYFNLNFQIRIS